MNVYIVGGGNVASDRFIRYTEEKPCDLLIAADGGLDYLYGLCQKDGSIMPDLMLGDFDSVYGDVLDYFRGRGVRCLTFPPEKDYTDGEIAMMVAIKLLTIGEDREYDLVLDEMKPGLSREHDEVFLFGLTGSRLDHTIGNIRSLKRFADAEIEASIIDDHNELTVKKCPADITLIRRDEYKYLSLLSLDGSLVKMSSTGLKYPLDGVSFTPGNAFGVSNEFSADTARISVEDEGALLIMRSRD